VVSFTSKLIFLRERLAFTNWLAGWWVPEPVWSPWSREKFLALAGKRTLADQPLGESLY
jgi:hypothetical protein